MKLMVYSRFRQLANKIKATNSVNMRFVALFSLRKMLYGNPALKNFFEFFIEFFWLIVFSVKAKIKGCI